MRAKSKASSGQKTADAMMRRAMRHARRKKQQKVDAEKAKEAGKPKVEEKGEGAEEKKKGAAHNLAIMKKEYPFSVSNKYVSYIPKGEMDVVDRGISLTGLRAILMEYLRNEEDFEKVQ